MLFARKNLLIMAALALISTGCANSKKYEYLNTTIFDETPRVTPDVTTKGIDSLTPYELAVHRVEQEAIAKAIARGDVVLPKSERPVIVCDVLIPESNINGVVIPSRRGCIKITGMSDGSELPLVLPRTERYR